MLTLQEAVGRLDEAFAATTNPVYPRLAEAIELVVVLGEVERLRGERPRQPTITNTTELTKPQQQMCMLLGITPGMDELPDVSDIDLMNYQFVGTNGDNISVQNPKAVMSKDEALVHAAYLALLADNAKARFAAVFAAIANT